MSFYNWTTTDKKGIKPAYKKNELCIVFVAIFCWSDTICQTMFSEWISDSVTNSWQMIVLIIHCIVQEILRVLAHFWFLWSNSDVRLRFRRRCLMIYIILDNQWPHFWSRSPIRLLLYNRRLNLVRACPDHLKAIVY